MKNLVTSLKALGAKMTGRDIAGKNLVRVIDNITENYEGSGGGGAFVIDVLDDTQHSGNSFVIDSDEPAGSEYYTNLLNEAYAAAESGRPVMIRAYSAPEGTPTGSCTWYQLIEHAISSGDKSLWFGSTKLNMDWSQGSTPTIYVDATRLTFQGSRVLSVLYLK